MSIRRRLVAALALAAAVVGVFTGCAYPSSARPACADAVLDDWTQGTLGAAYPADCYDAAIDALPEDLRAYTTAADDISRAADDATRSAPETRQLASAPGEAESVRALPAVVAVLGVLVAGLALSGLAASILRRRRAR